MTIKQFRRLVKTKRNCEENKPRLSIIYSVVKCYINSKDKDTVYLWHSLHCFDINGTKNKHAIK